MGQTGVQLECNNLRVALQHFGKFIWGSHIAGYAAVHSYIQIRVRRRPGEIILGQTKNMMEILHPSQAWKPLDILPEVLVEV